MSWPDGECIYEYPSDKSENRDAWQKGIDAALQAQTLTITPFEDSSTDFVLEGPCPRCGHPTSQLLVFEVIQTMGERGEEHTLPWMREIVCSCSGVHSGRPEKAAGCGWARGWPTELPRPTVGEG